MKKVKEIMTTDVTNVLWTTNLKRIYELFQDTGLSHLIVTDSVGTYKGIISKTDLLESVTKVMMSTSGERYTELELERIPASDVMTDGTVNLRPEDDVNYATEVLLQKKFHALPVVQNYSIIGIVTKHDLLKVYYESIAYTKNLNYE